MFLLVSLSKSKCFTRVALASHSCRLCSTRVAFVLHSCRSCITRVSLVSLVPHPCFIRVAPVALVSLVSGTRVVNQTRSLFKISTNFNVCSVISFSSHSIIKIYIYIELSVIKKTFLYLRFTTIDICHQVLCKVEDESERYVQHVVDLL